MNVSEIVAALDRKYTETPVQCPHEGKMVKLPQSGHYSDTHGALGVHASGSMLVCGRCDYKEPTSMGFVN